MVKLKHDFHIWETAQKLHICMCLIPISFLSMETQLNLAVSTSKLLRSSNCSPIPMWFPNVWKQENNENSTSKEISH